MEELRVPTRRVTVDLFTSDGMRAHGVMFHSESLYESGSAADIASELNDERDFIPFQSEAPETGDCLVSKRHLVRVHLAGLTAADLTSEIVDAPSLVGTCTLLLEDGSTRTGRPLVETPVELARLVDKFNQSPTFFPFVTDDGVDFVHTDRVVRVVLES